MLLVTARLPVEGAPAWVHQEDQVRVGKLKMTGRNTNRISVTGNDNARGMAGRIPHVPRRVSSCPLPLAPGFLTDAQRELVRTVIALAEVADLAEATKAQRLPPGEFNSSRLPDFGSDMSAYLPAPETLKLKKFIDEQGTGERTILIAVTHAGREKLRLTTSSVSWLLSNAASSADHAGSYLTSKTHLVRYLRDGLKKFESFSAGMSRRW